MSYTSAPYARTFTQAINASPTALAIPVAIDPLEVWVQSSAAILVRGAAGDPDFSLAANTVHRLPINAAAPLLFTNTATISVLVFGIANVTPVRFS
jgi:hypothetical protein